MKKIFSLFCCSAFLLFNTFTIAWAQQKKIFCAFDKKLEHAKQKNPVLIQQMQQQEQKIQSFIRQQRNKKKHLDVSANRLVVVNETDTTYEIPLVIHVVHTGEAVGTRYNPSDERLKKMVDYINATFAASYENYFTVGNGGTKVPMKFVLAKRDPKGQATTGIVRVDGSALSGYTAYGVKADMATAVEELEVKALSRWPVESYYNIWIVNKIDGSDGTDATDSYIAGYAYFPLGDVELDGTIMLASAAVEGEVILPHELGHAFNLYHTFEGSDFDYATNTYSCPQNTDPSNDNDKIVDTDPISQEHNFTCPNENDINECTGKPFGRIQNNIMGYAYCSKKLFTPGQKDRMIAALNELRPSLLSSAAIKDPTATVKPIAAPSFGVMTARYNIGPTYVELEGLKVLSHGKSWDDNREYIDNANVLGVEGLKVNKKYNLTIGTSDFEQYVKVWIDFDNNGEFSAEELIFNNKNNTDEKKTLSFTVPKKAVADTPLRMRVAADYEKINNATSKIKYGQVEDYYVTVDNSSLPIIIYNEKIVSNGSASRIMFNIGNASEVQSFEIQSSVDGKNFVTIETIVPTSVATQYEAILPINNVARAYRIKVISKEEVETFSTILFVQKTSEDIHLFPNPSINGVFKIALPAKFIPYMEVEILDVLGKKVWEKSYTSVNGVIEINAPLPNGIYWILVKDKENVWVKKLSVRK